MKINEEGVSSPLIEPGEADIIIAFEELEAYRWLPYLRKGGKMYVKHSAIMPMPVIMGKAKYPEDIIMTLEKEAGQVQGYRWSWNS